MSYESNKIKVINGPYFCKYLESVKIDTILYCIIVYYLPKKFAIV